MLHINLRIKFRFLFTDIYKTDQTFDIPLTSLPVPIAFNKVLFNDRGVYLHAWVDV